MAAMTRKRRQKDLKSSGATLAQVEQKVSSPASGKPIKLSESTVKSAVEALLKDHTKHDRKRLRRAQAQEKAGALLDAENFVTLMVTLKQPPFKDRLRPDAIRLKHSLVLDDDEVLLIVKDPQELVEDYLSEHGNGGVTKVLGVDEVRKQYGRHEARRELLEQFDHFLIDRRIAPMAPNLLGKAFISAKRMPLAVDLQRDVIACIQKTLSSTSYCARRGTSSSVRVGRAEMEAEAIVENVIGAVEGVVKKVAGGWDGIQSLMIKSNKSPALPLYVVMPGWIDTVPQSKKKEREAKLAAKSRKEKKDGKKSGEMDGADADEEKENVGSESGSEAE